MERWKKEWIESIIMLLNDPYGDYDRMRQQLKDGMFWKGRE